MTQDAIITTTHVSHSYPASRKNPVRLALNDINLDIQSQEIFGLLGPNGGGKSTLMKLIAGRMKLQCDSQIQIAGHPSGALILRHRVGVIFQQPALDKKLTCLENLVLHGKLYGMSRKESITIARDALEVMSVADRTEEFAGQLSGGLQRRVELAKVLMTDPQILLLDEPSSGLDPIAIHRFWETLEILRQEKQLTIVVATHHLEEAERCHRIAMLHEGNCVAIDAPDTLRNRNGNGQLVLTPLKNESAEELAEFIKSKIDFPATASFGRVTIKAPSLYELQQNIPNYTDWIKERHMQLGPPTLADTYLELTGQSLK